MAPSKLMSTLHQAQITFKKSHNEPATPHHQAYISGLRGVLVIQSLLWTFLQTFAPATVYPSSVVQTNGPAWQYVLRDVFSAPLWNTTLIYSFFIILSARTVCINFLANPSAATYAGSLIRRNLRIGIPISVATAIAIAIFTQVENGYIDQFNTVLPGSVVKAPTKPPTPLAGFLSIYNLLWVTRNWYQQAANNIWPTNTMWMPSLIYYQSYTVYIAMVILPFTRPRWHIQGCLMFALGSYWLETWGWYSITGLILADYSINSELQGQLKAGIPVTGSFRLPIFIPAVALVIIGFVQKYLWIAAFPNQLHNELKLHPTIWTADALSVSSFDTQPYARLDDWMIIVGVMVLIELFKPLQKALSVKPLTYLGDRSLSVFVVQGLVAYSVGIKAFVALTQTRGTSVEAACAVVFFTCIPLTILFAEVFHRLVDVPSQWIAKRFFVWLKE